MLSSDYKIKEDGDINYKLCLNSKGERQVVKLRSYFKTNSLIEPTKSLSDIYFLPKYVGVHEEMVYTK